MRNYFKARIGGRGRLYFFNDAKPGSIERAYNLMWRDYDGSATLSVWQQPEHRGLWSYLPEIYPYTEREVVH
jgi:hypothetical protein